MPPRRAPYTTDPQAYHQCAAQLLAPSYTERELPPGILDKPEARRRIIGLEARLGPGTDEVEVIYFAYQFRYDAEARQLEINEYALRINDALDAANRPHDALDFWFSASDYIGIGIREPGEPSYHRKLVVDLQAPARLVREVGSEWAIDASLAAWLEARPRPGMP